MKKCPRCFAEVSKGLKSCPKCGLAVDKMDEYAKRFNISDSETVVDDEEKVDRTVNRLSKKQQKKLLKKEKKQQKKEEKKLKKIRESKSDTDFLSMAVNSGVEDENILSVNDDFFTRRRKKKNKKEKPVFELDEQGEINIETSDVEIVGDKVGKKIDEQFEKSYSVKKARGDYKPAKIKWWEIYKLADRHFARKKIKKEVNKAARIKPSFIKKSKLLLLAIFLGWIGAHNFYAKNKKKGWVSVVCFVLFLFFFEMYDNNTAISSVSLFFGGLAGFIFVVIWIYDVINIIFNRFKYRLQIDKFIESMNVETRAKLGNKYIDMDLYYKPWWVKLKVNCKNLKRSFDEYRHESRQRKIAKKRKKLEAEQKILAESEAETQHTEQNERADDKTLNVAEVEQKTESKQSEKAEENKQTHNFVDEKTLEELKSFSGENAFVDALNEESEKTENSANSQSGAKKKGIDVPTKKYAKTVKNKKAAQKKKK